MLAERSWEVFGAYGDALFHLPSPRYSRRARCDLQTLLFYAHPAAVVATLAFERMCPICSEHGRTRHLRMIRLLSSC